MYAIGRTATPELTFVTVNRPAPGPIGTLRHTTRYKDPVTSGSELLSIFGRLRSILFNLTCCHDWPPENYISYLGLSSLSNYEQSLLLVWHRFPNLRLIVRLPRRCRVYFSPWSQSPRPPLFFRLPLRRRSDVLPSQSSSCANLHEPKP